MTSSRFQPILLAISMRQNEKTTLYIEHRGLTLEINYLPSLRRVLKSALTPSTPYPRNSAMPGTRVSGGSSRL